ncbi:MAG: hypothetical protein EHM93_04220 [Bacteroidales bacterium]|nr:MAG: hypothetical protein EHM93_04220 [Bacteroidales bacterium]
MNFIKLNTVILLLIASLALQGQTKKELEELYKDANSYYYFEDYEEALALFLQVYNKYPENYNLCFRIGVCYLNIPGYKHQSIPYLEKAATNTKRNYNEQSVLETKAPYDAVFYLGNAYFITNQLDKARKTYQKFKDLIKDEQSWNLAYYDHQVSTIKNSEILQTLPINFFRNNLGDLFNNRFANYNPIISGDEKTIAYTTKQRFYQAVYISRKNGETWGNPVNITLDLQVDGNCSTLSLSYDGNELYLFKDDSQDGNIYVSHFLNGAWSPMKKLNETINTKYYETHASVSKDGQKLYFTSNRKGGLGDQDIYVSTRVSGDIWSPAENLGATINTSLNENTPFITIDGTTLFFSSEGHNNLGCYDVFYSQKRADGAWSTPINLGYPINTTDDDLFFAPIGNGSRGLMAIFDKEGFGEQDIYQYDVFVPKYQKSIITSGDLLKINPDNRINFIVIDTINKSGLALTDFAKSGITALNDPKKNVKLFFNGREYELRDQVEKRNLITAQLQTSSVVKDEKIPPIAMISSPLVTDVNITQEKDFSTVQNRVNQLKGTSDSTRSLKSKTNADMLNDSKNTLGLSSDAYILGEANYLAEILTILSSNNSQSKVVDALNKDWHFPSSLLKLRISQFAMAVDSAGNKEEMLNTFTRFMDLLCSSEFVTLKNQSRTISGHDSNQAFVYLLKQLIDRASPELAEFIERVYQKYPTVNSFAKLWKLMRKEDPALFQKLLPEIVRLLAEISVETYIGLPEDQKFKLYEKITASAESKTNWWFLLIILGFVTLSTAGYFFFKRKHE